jgi:hypothetical protein
MLLILFPIAGLFLSFDTLKMHAFPFYNIPIILKQLLLDFAGRRISSNWLKESIFHLRKLRMYISAASLLHNALSMVH